ncbi:MAG: M4 family metallopeptidase, partial [Snowella sp.]
QGEDELSKGSPIIRTYNHKFRDIIYVSDFNSYLNVNGNCSGDCQQALNNAQIVAEFFQTNLPSEILNYISRINVDYYRDEKGNIRTATALWSGANKCAFFGRTYGQDLGSYASSLTVVAHEFGHMLNENRINLNYQGESGALDESYADIFAILVANREQTNDCNRGENWNWNLGEGVGYEHNSNSSLRSLQGRLRDFYGDYYPQTMSDYNPDKSIHFNSCIHSRAVYELLISRDHNNNYLLDISSATKLFYGALLKLKTSLEPNRYGSYEPTFLDSRNEMYSRAWTQFKDDPDPEKMEQVRNAIKRAFDSVGVFPRPQSDSHGKF